MSVGFDLDLLRTFAAVVDSGGFTKAAERVHLTQSTVSLQVKKLETNIGQSLLLRDKSTAEKMGHLFRVMALQSPTLPPPPGFTKGPAA